MRITACPRFYCRKSNNQIDNIITNEEVVGSDRDSDDRSESSVLDSDGKLYGIVEFQNSD
jgi:hypothetical protein